MSPNSLQQLLFPGADAILLKIISGYDDYERNLAARVFLELLVYLRWVLPQDCAYFMADTPACRLFQHAVFRTDEFTTFQRNLMQNIDTTPDPTELRLQLSLLQLSTQLRNQHISLSSEVNGLVELEKHGNELLQRCVNCGMLMRLTAADTTPTGVVSRFSQHLGILRLKIRHHSQIDLGSIRQHTQQTEGRVVWQNCGGNGTKGLDQVRLWSR